jgi:hypothetical protein
MFSRRMFLVLAACAILTSSTAFAGSGGTKKDATISIRNDTAGPIAAFVDPDPVKVGGLTATSTQAQIEAAGGKVVNPGATATVKVAAGTHSILVTAPAKFNSSSTIGKGQTKKYAFTGSAIVAY